MVAPAATGRCRLRTRTTASYARPFQSDRRCRDRNFIQRSRQPNCPVGKTYKLTPRTVELIDSLSSENETQRNVLAACAVILARPDPSRLRKKSSVLRLLWKQEIFLIPIEIPLEQPLFLEACAVAEWAARKFSRRQGQSNFDAHPGQRLRRKDSTCRCQPVTTFKPFTVMD
jgi:hypothetical protein